MNVFKLGLVGIFFGAGLAVTACASNSDKFVENCTPTLVAEGLSELAAKGACECARERLEKTLDGKQMSLASKAIGMTPAAANEYVSKIPGGEDVMEAADGAIKSCAM